MIMVPIKAKITFDAVGKQWFAVHPLWPSWNRDSAHTNWGQAGHTHLGSTWEPCASWQEAMDLLAKRWRQDAWPVAGDPDWWVGHHIKPSSKRCWTYLFGSQTSPYRLSFTQRTGGGTLPESKA